MANKTINDLTTTTSAATGDFVPIWRASNGDTRKITKTNFIGAIFTGGGTLATGGFTLNVGSNSTINGSVVGSMTGGGTIATGGFILTVPATGTAVLLTEAQTITGVKTFSNGIIFANETLDFYDEGTFTPVVADDVSAGNVASVSSSNGFYTVVGDIVTCWINIQNINTTGMTGANALIIRGLPFASVNLTNYAAIGVVQSAHLTYSGIMANASLGANGTAVVLYDVTSGTDLAIITVSDVANSACDIAFLLVYKKA